MMLFALACDCAALMRSARCSHACLLTPHPSPRHPLTLTPHAHNLISLFRSLLFVRCFVYSSI